MESYAWRWQQGSELGAERLYELLALRVAVFVVEQQCPYQELDGLDLLASTQHLAVESGGQPVATLRLLVPENDREAVVIGRVVIAQGHRGTGLGHTLLQAALERIETTWPGREAYLSAQAHLQAYYGRHGFEPVTEVYLEDD
ncbi:GNAT family N-acetyltransferase, partial [Salinicola rhizosphaerae]|uniref:GNAT family N-acetyltransferase n=1 Tax=Salinicola rhizosphaerae TaxID=1443141 RepID=UPI001674BFF2